MSFIADQQTLTDLNLMGKYRANSIFSLFNKVHTAGGERLLEQWFRYPLTDQEHINERSSFFKYFQEKGLQFPFKRETFSQAEQYMGSAGAGSYPKTTASVVLIKLQASFLNDNRYEDLHSGLLAVISILSILRTFLDQIRVDKESPYEKEQEKISSILNDHRLQALKNDAVGHLPLLKVIKYTHLLRNTLQTQMEYVLECLYQLDVYIAVSQVATNRKLVYAKALSSEVHQIDIQGLRHLGIEKAVGNSLSLNCNSNLLFLTGANMAGKSTLMKSFGIAVYLAHMGFPVAASQMEFSIMDGLYSSINVPDNLDMGYSHFYAEVLRVKMAAEEVSDGKNMVVIFDELFKGTNVKDAYDATLSVTDAFSKYQNCYFIISTHIIEVGQALHKDHPNMQFAYLPTIMDGLLPRYPYTLVEGITNDRHGMMIIQNEGILDILN